MEAHTKEVGRGILVDADTRSGLEDRVSLEPLGTIQFKGKAEAVKVFAVLARA